MYRVYKSEPLKCFFVSSDPDMMAKNVDAQWEMIVTTGSTDWVLVLNQAYQLLLLEGEGWNYGGAFSAPGANT
jgi:hypothetical protein